MKCNYMSRNYIKCYCVLAQADSELKNLTFMSVAQNFQSDLILRKKVKWKIKIRYLQGGPKKSL